MTMTARGGRLPFRIGNRPGRKLVQKIGVIKTIFCLFETYGKRLTLSVPPKTGYKSPPPIRLFPLSR